MRHPRLRSPRMRTTSPRQVNWLAVVVFFTIACAWSWPFFWWRDMHPESFRAFPLPYPLKNALLMWGPGIAALVCLRWFRSTHVRTIVMFGGARLRALAFYGVPMLALALVGIDSPEFGGVTHAMVLVIAIVGFVNILGEELGWRGFLQDALRPLSRPGRYVLIGLMWVSWHFTNLFAHREGAELWFYLGWYVPLTITLSVLIGEATDQARAVVVAVTLHAWMNLLMEFGAAGTYAVFACALPFWVWLLRGWPREERDEGNATIAVAPDAMAAGRSALGAPSPPGRGKRDGEKGTEAINPRGKRDGGN
jgi:uncharacterized protein